MLRHLLLFCLFVFLCIPDSSSAQDKAEAMKAWMENMTPGPVHKMMAELTGEWTCTTKMYQPGAAEATTSEGLCKMEMLLEGRYLKGDFSAQVMGMNMLGISLMSFDNGTQEYTSIWIDNTSTGMMVTKGKLNPKTNEIELYGDYYDPMSKKTLKTLMVMTMGNKDKFEQMLYTLEGDKRVLNMEMFYTRKK